MSAAEYIGVSSTTFTQCAPEATEFGEITQNKSHCAVLLVISTNLSPILHRFRDIAFDMSEIALFGYPSCV